MLAKAVRRSSAKMLGRERSPNMFGLPSPEEEGSPVTVRRESETPPPVVPPSPVVMRYWKQCSSTADSGYFGEEGIDLEEVARDENGEVIPPWKMDAIEGEEKEFPSIASKIKQMEEEAKKPLAMYEVPDVKSKMKTGAPAAKWMEARGKLQSQLDTLISKTSEKMAKYGTIHAKEKVEFKKESSSESEGRSPSPKEMVDNSVKTLIKTVATEIQKSFSTKSIHTLGEDDDDDDDEEDEEESEEEIKLREERERQLKEREKKIQEKQKRRTIKEVKRRQKHIDMEAPILDFELKEPTPELESEEEEEIDDEVADDLESPAGTINLSAAKGKASMMRKTSSERRLPAGVLAKKKAAEKAKESNRVDASTSTESAFTEIELAVAEKLARKELFSDKVIQTQWEISNAEFELSKLSDNEKATMLSKQIARMKSSHVNKLLKSIDSGVLDISLPLLIPFLSLQVRMSLGIDLFKNRFKGATSEAKNKMAKETFVDTMIKDITDIALLQEVIARSQEKVLLLSAEDERRFAEKMRHSKLINIENDSFEIGSSTPDRPVTPVVERRSISRRSATPNVAKGASPEAPAIQEVVTGKSRERTTSPVAKNDSPSETSKKEEEETIPYGVTDVPDDEEETGTEENEDSKPVDTADKKAADEGCPTSESDEEKEEEKSKGRKDEESDEGLGKSDDNASKVEEEAPKEKQIKQKILDILQDAKAVDQKRNIRNYGRTFEFQGVKEQLRPVLPNDKRPQKAKRLDTLWSEVTAKKQGLSQPAVPSLEELKARKNDPKNAAAVPTLEELKNKPRSSVPWTRKVNAQPVKKEVLAAQKEVDEFESCRKTLQQNVKNEAVPSNTRKIQTVKKDEIISICNTAISEETKEKVIIESIKDSPKEIESAKVDVEKTEAKEVTCTMAIMQESVDNVSEKDTVNPISITETESAVTEEVKTESAVKAVESDSSKVKVSDHKETSKESLISSSGIGSCSESEWEVSEEEEIASKETKKTTPVKKEATPVKREATPVKREVTPVKREATPVRRSATPIGREATPVRREATPVRREATPVRREATPVKREATPARRSATPVKKERSPEKPPIGPKPAISIKEIPSLLLMGSPAPRRRGAEATPENTITVSASIRLPPPPSFRPPPPPVSPPVPVSKVKDLNMGAESSEEESEWEYGSSEEE